MSHSLYPSDSQEFDLTNCDREPIHIPGSIQPHGVLIALQEPELTILQISQNTLDLFKIPPESLLNQNLDQLLGEYQTDIIKNALLNYSNFEQINPIKLSVRTPERILMLNGVFHHSNNLLILELEPSLSEAVLSFLNLYHTVRNSAKRIQNASTFQELCEVIVNEISRMTGFDRVMLYQFSPEGHGTIIAEEKRETLPAFLGLRYPSSDVPQPARRLYTNNWIRSIPNINYQPVKLIVAPDLVDNQPLDLSFSVLRSVSPFHIEYLRNMGVTASMSISIIQDGTLWGLIACHHYSPKYISYEVRSACEFLGQVVSLQLPYTADREYQDYRLYLKSIQTKLIEQIFQENDIAKGLLKHQPNLLDVCHAEGSAIWLNGTHQTIGVTPKIEEIIPLIDWLSQSENQDIFQTYSLGSCYPPAEAFKAVVSGLLAICITPGQYILWFRPEVIQTVDWAGNPHKPVEVNEDGELCLSPRRSFELWKEIVRGQSLPWEPCEIESALELRHAIVKIVLRQSDELAKLNQALQQSELEAREKAIQLEAALNQLKQTQTQLIQSEKLSSLGQMVAGIAHEINNPINFIYGNLEHVQTYALDLLKLLELYQEKFPEPGEEIEDEIEAIDLEFLQEDLPKILVSMQVGTERICDLVNSLRNFSRVDESDVKKVNIHEGIDSTLLILSNRLKEKASQSGIEVIKDYGEIPLVECYASQLNQVFMNILANAIDALEECDRQRPPQEKATPPSTITIRTRLARQSPEPDRVIIQIIDNGPGIPEEIQACLFDPFFTTKPVGKGTGIGLAISYQIIVEKHRGQIYCHSQPGQGAEFVIELPIA